MLILHGVRHLQLPQPNGKSVQLNGTIGQMAKKPSKKRREYKTRAVLSCVTKEIEPQVAR
jgi:hypothetical protein